MEMTWLDFSFLYFINFNNWSFLLNALKPSIIYGFSGSASLLALSVFMCDPNRGYSGHLWSQCEMDGTIKNALQIFQIVIIIMAPGFFWVIPVSPAVQVIINRLTESSLYCENTLSGYTRILEHPWFTLPVFNKEIAMHWVDIMKYLALPKHAKNVLASGIMSFRTYYNIVCRLSIIIHYLFITSTAIIIGIS